MPDVIQGDWSRGHLFDPRPICVATPDIGKNCVASPAPCLDYCRACNQDPITVTINFPFLRRHKCRTRPSIFCDQHVVVQTRAGGNNRQHYYPKKSSHAALLGRMVNDLLTHKKRAPLQAPIFGFASVLCGRFAPARRSQTGQRTKQQHATRR